MYTLLRPLTRFALASLAAIALSAPSQAVPVTYTGGGFDIPVGGINPGDGVGTLVVPDLGPVTNFLNVQITISTPHTYRDDLTARLTSPTGTVVALFPFLGGSSDWLAGTFTLVDGGGAPIPHTGSEGEVVDWAPGTYDIQGGSYASFLGVQGDGLWTLTVNDRYFDDSGSASSWSITLDQDAAAAGVPELDGSAATMPLSFFLGIGLLLGGKRRRA